MLDADRFALGQHHFQRILGIVLLNVQHLHHAGNQFFLGQKDMTVLKRIISAKITDPRGNSGGCVAFGAKLTCDGIRLFKADAVDLLAQQIRVFPDDVDRRPTPAIVYTHSGGRSEVILTEHHDRADTELLAEVGGDFGRLLLGNAGNLRKPVGVIFKDIEGILAERFHDQLCRFRTDALDRFGGEVFENRGRGCRQLLFKIFDFELPSE